MGNEKSGVLIIAALLVIVLFILAALHYAGYLAVGTTTLGISLVRTNSTDPHLNGDLYLISLVANTNNEHQYGQWTPKNQGDPKDFSISYDSFSQFCKFPLHYDANQPIYTAWYKETSGWNSPGCITGCFDANNWCITQNHGYAVGGGSNSITGQYSYWCVGLNKIAYQGFFQNDQFIWRGSFSVTSGNGTVSSPLLSTDGAHGVTLSDSANTPEIYITWAGNLDTGQDCEAKYPVGKDQVVPVYNQNAQQWNLASPSGKSNYNAYCTDGGDCSSLVSKLRSQDAYSNPSTARQAVLATFNSYANGLNTNWGGLGSWAYASVDTSDTSNPFAKEDTSSLQNPVFNMYLKANWVGVYFTCADPQITQYDGSLSGTAIKDTLTGTATIKNLGSVQSVFSAYIQCPNGINPSQIPDVSIAPGNTVQIQYSLTAAQAVSGTCTLNVYSAGACSSHSTSKQFYVGFKKFCSLSCTGNFAPDMSACKCVCALTPRTCYTIDTTNCVYQAIANCGGSGACTKSCPDRYMPDSGCSFCVCALDPNKAAPGYTLNATSCQYEQIPSAGGSTGQTDWSMAALGGGFILIVLGVLLMVLRRKK